MRFEVGDVVVYGSHGAGRVLARMPEAPDGADAPEVVVVEFGEGLVVTLPLERARVSMRPLSSDLEVAGVRRVLRSEGPTLESVWLKRCKETREKVSGGDAIELAEVVRDSACRDREPAPGGGARLSVTERQLYLKARKLLALEIGLARGVEPSEADDWIAHQLSLSGA